MKLVIEINLDNDGIQTGADAANLLTAIATCLSAMSRSMLASRPQSRIRDINGNTIGEWRIK